MRRHTKAVLLLILTLLTGAAMSQPLQSADLSPYRWQNRLLLLFAPSPEDRAYGEQMRLLENETAALEDRDLLVFHLFGDSGGLEDTSPEVAANLRERYDVAEDAFTVILVGKDGGEKERYRAPVAPETFYSAIDAMPMRRREMRGGD